MTDFFFVFCFGVALLRSIFFCCQFTNPLEFVCFCEKSWVVKWSFDVKRDIVEKHWSICVYWDQFLTFLDFLRISDFAIMAEHDMGPETLTLSRGKFPISFSRLFWIFNFDDFFRQITAVLNHCVLTIFSWFFNFWLFFRQIKVSLS